jgi:hypothetical protein
MDHTFIIVLVTVLATIILIGTIAAANKEVSRKRNDEASHRRIEREDAERSRSIAKLKSEGKERWIRLHVNVRSFGASMESGVGGVFNDYGITQSVESEWLKEGSPEEEAFRFRYRSQGETWDSSWNESEFNILAEEWIHPSQSPPSDGLTTKK